MPTPKKRRVKHWFYKYFHIDADLEIVLNISTATPTSGGDVIFYVTASNAGPSVAENTSVQMTFPEEFTFASSSATLGSYSDSTDIWSIGTLGVGDSAILTLDTTVSGSGAVAVSGSVDSDQADSDLSNNTDSVDITIS